MLHCRVFYRELSQQPNSLGLACITAVFATAAELNEQFEFDEQARLCESTFVLFKPNVAHIRGRRSLVVHGEPWWFLGHQLSSDTTCAFFGDVCLPRGTLVHAVRPHICFQYTASPFSVSNLLQNDGFYDEMESIGQSEWNQKKG